MFVKRRRSRTLRSIHDRIDCSALRACWRTNSKQAEEEKEKEPSFILILKQLSSAGAGSSPRYLPTPRGSSLATHQPTNHATVRRTIRRTVPHRPLSLQDRCRCTAVPVNLSIHLPIHLSSFVHQAAVLPLNYVRTMLLPLFSSSTIEQMGRNAALKSRSLRAAPFYIEGEYVHESLYIVLYSISWGVRQVTYAEFSHYRRYRCHRRTAVLPLPSPLLPAWLI